MHYPENLVVLFVVRYSINATKAPMYYIKTGSVVDVKRTVRITMN